MKRTGIEIIFWGAVCVAGWHLGGVITPQVSALGLGAIFGTMAAIPAILIATTQSQRVRHDHYHYTPAPQPAQLPARPTRYIIVTNRPSLPVATQSKIEVKQ